MRAENEIRAERERLLPLANADAPNPQMGETPSVLWQQREIARKIVHTLTWVLERECTAPAEIYLPGVQIVRT